MAKEHGFDTRAVHSGQDPDPGYGSTVPPIHLTSTFTQEAIGRHKGHEYARVSNPTRTNLERAIAELEGGVGCCAFGSGMAATTALLQTLRPGDGVAAGRNLYGGTYRVLEQVFRPWGLEIAYAPEETVEGYAEAIESLTKPVLVWQETPTNPLLEVTDITAVADLAHRVGAKLAVDNTFASPALQRPLALGAHYVMHSTTKYLGGHSDVLGGAIVGKTEEDVEPVRFQQKAAGAIPSPFDCWLVQRGIKTLSLRMERHCSNAMR